MNDNTSFERYVAEAFDREGTGRPVPDAIHHDLITRAGRQRQWPTWLASVKEPPMRLSNANAVGSPTIRVVAIMAATFLLILALAAVGIAGQRLFAADGTIIVDADGGGDFTTIADAVAVAQDGESILVKNGTYAESVTITEDITLFGESRDGVVIEIGAGCRMEGEGEFAWERERVCEPGVLELEGTPDFWGPGTYGLHLVDSNASVSDLTFRHQSPSYGIYVTGGAPTIERVTYAGNTYNDPNGGNTLMLRGGTSATVTDVDLSLGGSFGVEDGSPVTIEDSNGAAFFSVAPRDEVSGGPAVFRNNTLAGPIWAEGQHIIEGNTIDMALDQFDFAGIFLNQGTGWVVEGNTVTNASNPTGAIDIGDQAGHGMVIDNDVAGSKVGILVSAPRTSGVEVIGNRVSDGEIGLRITSGVAEVRGNTVEGMSTVGINVGSGDTLVSDNTACGNTTDLLVSELSDAVVDDTNEFCVVNDMRAS